MGFLSLLVQWVFQGVITFAMGLLPLSIPSQSLLASLTMFGTGRLIGSGLLSFFGSVVFGALIASIPEIESGPPFSQALEVIFHIVGILFMFVAERRLSSRTLNTTPPAGLDSNASPSSPTIAAPDDMELEKRLQAEDMGAQTAPASRSVRALAPHQRRVYLFTFAFVVGEIVAGITVGRRAMAPPWKPDNAGGDRFMHSLPGPVMMYLLELVEQVPTTLGFATTLLSTSLPIAEYKRHVLLYAAAQPLTALLSYAATALSRIVPTHEGGSVIGSMRFFANGLFVYAALIVRALIANSRTTARSGLLARMLLMAAGALLPYVLAMLLPIWMWWSNQARIDPGEQL